MRNVLIAVVAAFCLTSILPADAQNMRVTVWSAFGVSFKVPANVIIEDDSEEGYTLSDDTYYINVQILDGEAMNKDNMADEITQLATEDQLSNLTPVKQFDLPQFHGVQLQGTSEGEYYLYNYLMSKDEGGGFFVTVIYKDKADNLPSEIIKSFKLED